VFPFASTFKTSESNFLAILSKVIPCTVYLYLTQNNRHLLPFQKFPDVNIWRKLEWNDRSRGSSVSAVTRLRYECVWLLFPVGAGIFFSSPPRPDRLWGPPSLLSKFYRGAHSPDVQLPCRGSDHSPPHSVEVKNAWG
jgi:hypothetical protein